MAEKKVPCEVYSRVVGYLRPVQNWNKGKRQEFKERVTYDPEKGEPHASRDQATSQAGVADRGRE